jgi:hypothetical protein
MMQGCAVQQVVQGYVRTIVKHDHAAKWCSLPQLCYLLWWVGMPGHLSSKVEQRRHGESMHVSVSNLLLEPLQYVLLTCT